MKRSNNVKNYYEAQMKVINELSEDHSELKEARQACQDYCEKDLVHEETDNPELSEFINLNKYFEVKNPLEEEVG